MKRSVFIALLPLPVLQVDGDELVPGGPRGGRFELVNYLSVQGG